MCWRDNRHLGKIHREYGKMIPRFCDFVHTPESYSPIRSGANTLHPEVTVSFDESHTPLDPKKLLTPLDKCLDRLNVSLKQASSRHEIDDCHRRERLLLVSLRALLDSRDVPTWLKSISGHMLYVNPAYTRRFGLSVEQYGGRADAEVWDPNTAAMFEELDRRALDAAGCITATVEVAGDTLTVRKWPVFMEGQVMGVAGEIV